MVVVEGVIVLDGVLLDGIGTTASDGTDESSAVLITAKINTTSRTTAAAPAAKITAGRSNQFSGSSSSAGTPEC